MKQESSGVQKNRTLVLDIWLSFVVVTFAIWWGGLTFYAALVVPIGTDLLGSTGQGFITQQVTFWHNGILVLATSTFAVEAWRRRDRWLIVCVIAMSMIAAGLFIQHARLTGLMDFQSESVSDGFYLQHQVYLWLTVAEWMIGLIGVFLFVKRSGPLNG